MGMRITEGLAVEAVMVRPPWRTFDEVITGLVGRLASCGSLPAALAEQAVHRIREREAIASTAMVDIGVSIPHARVEGIEGVVVALAVSPTVVYEVADGLPISIVALVLSSPSLTGEHLNFLPALSMLLQSEHTRDQLRHAADAAEAMQVVQEDEARL